MGIVALLPYRHFLSDDGFIYLRFVRNLTEAGIFSYNLPIPTYGFTGPLWVIILSGVNVLVRDPFITAKIVAFTLSAFTVAAYFRLCHHFVHHTAYAFIATVALVVDPWFAKWMVSGLENPLTLVLLFTSLLLHLRTRGTERVSILAYFLVGLGILSRPEMLIYAGVLILDILIFERSRRALKLLVATICVGLPNLMWIGFAQWHFGTFIPNTILAKSVEAQFRSTYFDTFIRCTQIVAGSTLLPCMAILGLGAVSALRGEFRWSCVTNLLRTYLVPLSWCLVLIAFYVIGRATVSGRYLLAITPIITLLGVAALESLLALLHSSRLRQILATAFGVVLVAQLGFLQYRYTFFVTKWEQGMDPNLIKIATWLRDNTSPHITVASHEIGVLGYFSERRVLDTGGLCSPEFIPELGNAEKLNIHLRSLKPDYIMTDSPFRKLEGAHGELVFAVDVQREGSSALGDVQQYHLTRLHYFEVTHEQPNQ